MNALENEMDEQQPSRDQLPPAKQWWALVGLCVGVLLTTLEVTIVNVALPFIRKELTFTETSLMWVINVYLLAFGGFLLLSGRLGDLYGHRRLFLTGILLFTFASLACGLAGTQGQLIAARAIQGVGGATIETTALSQIVALFPLSAERAKAVAVYSFVCAGGGSIGLVLGGLLTGGLNWRWVFLVNVPIGIAVWVWCFSLIPKVRIASPVTRPDFFGALLGTASLILAIFVIGNAQEAGWLSPQTLLSMAAAVVGFTLFFNIEARATSPLLPLRIFRIRSLAVANLMAVHIAAFYTTWLTLSALHMERVLGYGPMQIGLVFLPASLITSALLLGVSAKIVGRFGIARPITAGLALVVVALALLVRAPIQVNPWLDIMPSMVLLGVGMGIAYNPLMLAPMSGVGPNEEGLASGILNTSFVLGGAIGLAVITSLSSMRTDALLSSGASLRVALNGGYHVGMALVLLFVAIAATIGWSKLPHMSTTR
jgi:EmrB/QacA subfamily drug resistance transporter